MKVGIITFHRARNYGAVLQAYALMTFINENFDDVIAEIIDYRSYYIEDFYKIRKLTGSFWRKILQKIKNIKYESRNKHFQKFIDSRLVLSKKCDRDNIVDICDYDRYISGSDMIWHWHTTDSGEYFDENYFLNFVKNNNIKLSYAASFGFDQIPDKYFDFYKRMLGSYSRISVREESGIKIIKKLLQKNAQANIDPTLLFDKSRWKKIAVKPKKTRYLLLYEVGGISENLMNCAKRIAKEKKIELIILCSEFMPKLYYKNKNVFFGYTPEEFLGWFENAEYIVTNSFHGTAFSVIFHKCFLVEINAWERNNRAYELMKKIGAEDRVIGDGSDIDASINWKNIDKVLCEEREKTLKFLKESLC